MPASDDATPMNSRSLPLAVLAASSCMWGLAWIPIKSLGASGVGGLALVLVASCAAGVVLLPRLIGERAAWRADLGGLVLIALLGGYSNLSFAIATLHGDIVRVMVLFYLLPAWSVLGGWLWLGERLDAARLTGVGMALAGAWLTLGGPSVQWTGGFAWPDLMAISCGIAFAGNNLLFRAKQAIPVGSKTAAMLVGAAVMAAGLLVADAQPWPTASSSAWLGSAGYGLGWLLIATLATQYGVTHLEAGRASIIIVLELVIAVVSAMIIGGERMSGLEATGGALILLAALLEARRGNSVPGTELS